MCNATFTMYPADQAATSKQAKRARFNNQVLVNEIPSHRTYSADERASSWYSLGDYRRFKLGIDFDMLCLVVGSGSRHIDPDCKFARQFRRPRSENDAKVAQESFDHQHSTSTIGSSSLPNILLNEDSHSHCYITRLQRRNDKDDLSLTQNELQESIKLIERQQTRYTQTKRYMQQLHQMKQQMNKHHELYVKNIHQQKYIQQEKEQHPRLFAPKQKHAVGLIYDKKGNNRGDLSHSLFAEEPLDISITFSRHQKQKRRPVVGDSKLIFDKKQRTKVPINFDAVIESAIRLATDNNDDDANNS